MIRFNPYRLLCNFELLFNCVCVHVCLSTRAWCVLSLFQIVHFSPKRNQKPKKKKYIEWRSSSNTTTKYHKFFWEVCEIFVLDRLHIIVKKKWVKKKRKNKWRWKKKLAQITQTSRQKAKVWHSLFSFVLDKFNCMITIY